jgi:hypothetical protein
MMDPKGKGVITFDVAYLVFDKDLKETTKFFIDCKADKENEVCYRAFELYFEHKKFLLYHRGGIEPPGVNGRSTKAERFYGSIRTLFERVKKVQTII